jgi:hypothetical protein
MARPTSAARKRSGGCIGSTRPCTRSNDRRPPRGRPAPAGAGRARDADRPRRLHAHPASRRELPAHASSRRRPRPPRCAGRGPMAGMP